MATLLQNTQLRTIDIGRYADRAAQALPQSASQNIFTVSNGGIVLTGFLGRVATALGATATNLKVTFTPTVGSAQDIAANLAIASLPAGTSFSLNPTFGSALVASGVSGIGPIAPTPRLFVPPGVFSITTSANDTGTVEWTMTYIPLDNGAQVAVN